MELAVISDSHIPERQQTLPDRFRERIAAADHTIHAGDFATSDVLDEVRDLANELTAVHGNVDPDDLGLPAVDSVTAGGVTFVVTHGTINPVAAAVDAAAVETAMERTDDGEITSFDATIESEAGLVLRGEEWADAIADTARARGRNEPGDTVVGVGGHTHVVEDTVHEGVRVLNPGSVTGADPAERATMMTVRAGDGEIEVTLHED
ncbi:phosphodiesterase, family [Halolamina pelagica]|uniref:Phosphoesterase n=1 Tax=Halolamina pelagica TaxID=699431 RepID=A0A0P7H161_9EURY|nr:metallophosphoesterase family protein [Halolamina pelagica]KPN32061.1 phosphodiesterase, family [Halolamina pelagica]